jgi:hypothetical protein
VCSWRRTGKNQDRNSGASTPTGTKDKATPAGNTAWGGKGKTAPGTQSAAPEHHVPVREFNANEVREFLRKSMSCTWRAVACMSLRTH